MNMKIFKVIRALTQIFSHIYIANAKSIRSLTRNPYGSNAKSIRSTKKFGDPDLEISDPMNYYLLVMGLIP